MIERWPPDGAEILVSFSVRGDPKPAGSKDAIPLGRWVTDGGRKRFIPVTRGGTGVPIVNVVDSSGAAGENWRTDIRAACAAAIDLAEGLTDGPIAVRVTFYGASPKGRYGTGRNASVLKPTADRFPHASQLPDGTKLARSLEDALNAYVWADDRRVCDMWWSRRFAEDWELGVPGARVDIYTLPLTVGEHLPVLSGDQLVIIHGDGIDERAEALAGGDR